MMETETIGISTRPRRRLWLWGALITSVGLLIAGSWLGYEWYLNRDLERAIAEADRLDPGWRLAELEAARAEVPDDENSALQVLAVIKLLPPSWSLPPSRRSPTLEDALDHLSPNLPLDESQRKERDNTGLGKASAALSAARRLAEMPRGRYVIHWSPDGISTLIPHGDQERQVSWLLRLDAHQRAEGGDIDGALISCRALLNSGRSFSDEPFIISQFVRLIGRRLAIRSLERALANGEASESALEAVQRLLQDEGEQPILLMQARAERAGIHQFLEVFESRKLNRASWGLASRTGSYQIDDFLDQGKARASHAEYLRYLNEFVEIAKLPSEQQVEQLRHFELKPPQNVPPLLAGITEGGDVKKVAASFHYNLAFVRCAVVAVAAERYRLANGRWPDRLEDLVPVYLSKLPLDPFDGQPLRFRRLKDGVIIYTVGEDQQDDGGRRLRIKAGEPDRDVGFQLWDAERRRAPEGR